MASSRLLWSLCILGLSVGSNARFLHRASHPTFSEEHKDEAAVTSLVKQAASSSYKTTEVCMVWLWDTRMTAPGGSLTMLLGLVLLATAAAPDWHPHPALLGLPWPVR